MHSRSNQLFLQAQIKYIVAQADKKDKKEKKQKKDDPKGSNGADARATGEKRKDPEPGKGDAKRRRE